jgi:hypothetical protein
MWNEIQASLHSPNFWNFQAKDVLSPWIALTFSAITVFLAYMFPRKLYCDVSDIIRLGYGQRPQHDLLIRIDVTALNQGARPRVLKRMELELESATTRQKFTLHWTEVLKSENIAEKGQVRKLWTDFAGNASPVYVPKYDAKSIDAAFWAHRGSDLVADSTYRFRLIWWTAGRKDPIWGRWLSFELKQPHIDVLNTLGTPDEHGIRKHHLALRVCAGGTTFEPIASQFRNDPPLSALPVSVAAVQLKNSDHPNRTGAE